MNATKRRVLTSCVLIAGVFAMTGCAFVTDMINPDLLSNWGIDSSNIIRSQGSIILAFRNSTVNITAEMAAFTTAYSTIANEEFTLENPYVDYWFVTDLAAGETRTVVVECPVNVLLPVASVAVTDTESETIEYTGSELRNLADFQCGDVIEYEMFQGTDGVSVRVRVIPGR